jgi:hypothetical protein
VDFRGERRSRGTRESKTDPDALLFRKSKGTTAKLSHMGRLLLENRHGLVIAQVTQATGTAERGRHRHGRSAHRHAPGDGGADKNCDTKGFVEAMRAACATPRVGQNTTRQQFGRCT